MKFARLAKASLVATVLAGVGACTSHALSAAPLDPEDAGSDAEAGASDAASCDVPSASPACAFDAAPTYDDAGTGCSFGRADLTCRYTSGLTSLCVTADASCDVSHIADPGALVCCTNACAPNEYGAACAGSSPGANCRNVGIAPGGHGFYCCTCE